MLLPPTSARCCCLAQDTVCYFRFYLERERETFLYWPHHFEATDCTPPPKYSVEASQYRRQPSKEHNPLLLFLLPPPLDDLLQRRNESRHQLFEFRLIHSIQCEISPYMERPFALYSNRASLGQRSIHRLNVWSLGLLKRELLVPRWWPKKVGKFNCFFFRERRSCVHIPKQRRRNEFVQKS